MTEKRDKGIYIKMTQEELDAIDEKMANANIHNRSGFIRKMAIDGLLIQLDMPELKEIGRLLGITANNVNQIAKKANETDNIYGDDIADVSDKFDDIRRQFGELLQALAKLQKSL